MSAAELLHRLDKHLCGLIGGDLGGHMQQNGEFAEFAEKQMGPALFQWARDPQRVGSEDLLSKAELEDLAEVITIAAHSGATGPRSPALYTAFWQSGFPEYIRPRACLPEIRKLFGDSIADEFARASEACARRLSGEEPMKLSDAIDVIAKWIDEIRGLLRDLQRKDLLPRPLGNLPTPTQPAKADKISTAETSLSTQDAGTADEKPPVSETQTCRSSLPPLAVRAIPGIQDGDSTPAAESTRASDDGSSKENLLTTGEWLIPPTSLANMANRLGNIGRKKAKSALKPYGLQQAGNRQSWTVRLDKMPPNMRNKLTEVRSI